MIFNIIDVILGIKGFIATKVVFTYIRAHQEYVTLYTSLVASGWRENSEICTVHFFAFNHLILLMFAYLQPSYYT